MTEPGPRRARANASKSRAELLTIAESVVATRGVAALSMNTVATAAGVGVGTVYNRFGDQGGLVEALMTDRESRLQHDMHHGAPPLGPGAAPFERIRAFLHAYTDVLEDYAPLMAVAEATMSPQRRFRTGPYAVHHDHLEHLLVEAGHGTRASYLADALLAPLAAALFSLQRHEEHAPLDSIKAGLDGLLGLARPGS